jgi:hypothetical protein
MYPSPFKSFILFKVDSKSVDAGYFLAPVFSGYIIKNCLVYIFPGNGDLPFFMT